MNEEDSAGTSTIRHDPVIQRASEHHEHKTGHILKVRRYIISLIIILTNIIAGLILYRYGWKHDGVKPSFGDKTCLFLSYTAFSIAFGFVLFSFMTLGKPIIYRWKKGGRFVSGILGKYSISLSLVTTLVFISYIIKANSTTTPSEHITIIKNDDKENKQGGITPTTPKDDKTEEKKAEEDYDNSLSGFFMGLGMAFGIFLIKDLILYALNYNVHFAYYSNRIDENTDQINLLKALNSVVNAGYTDNVDAICGELMKSIGNDNDTIQIADFKRAISEEDALKVFKYLKKEEDATLKLGDLKKLYRTTLSDQQQISVGLVQNNSAVDNLDFVATFFCVPLAVMFFLNSLNLQANSTAKAGIIMSGLVSGGFIFSDAIKNFIGSLIFVFFIRPFDVNDFVKVDDKLYKVKEINILTSTLSESKLAVIFPNSKLLQAQITNFRLSKTYEEAFTFTFDISDFKSRQSALKEKIDLFMTESPVIYRKKSYFKNSKITSSSTIEVSIVVGFNIENVAMKQLIANREQFVLDLNDLFDKTGLRPSKK